MGIGRILWKICTGVFSDKFVDLGPEGIILCAVHLASLSS